MDMFHHGWSNYMRHAFPKDDLRPLSCRGKNSQGGIGLTLIDALDTLLVGAGYSCLLPASETGSNIRFVWLWL